MILRIRIIRLIFVAGITVIFNLAYTAHAAEQPKEILLKELREADKALNVAFKEAQGHLDEKGKQDLRKEQQVWLKERDKKCGSVYSCKTMEDWLRNAVQEEKRGRCVLEQSEYRTAWLSSQKIPVGRGESISSAGKYMFEDSAENEDAPKIPVCRDFLANLKALGEPPMVCNRKFHPKFKQFGWPKWTTLDAWENRDLIFQIWDEQYKNSYGDTNLRRSLEMSKQHLKQNVVSGNITLAVTRLQIDGKSADVLQFVEAMVNLPCTDDGFASSPLFGRQHYIIDLTKRKVDFKATEDSVLRGLHGSANDGYFKATEDSVLRRFHGDANEHYADLFLYQGLPYVAFWYGDSQRGVLVLGSELDGDYCIIEYNKTKQKGEKK